MKTFAIALIYISLNSLTNHYLMPCVEEFIDRLSTSLLIKDYRRDWRGSLSWPLRMGHPM